MACSSCGSKNYYCIGTGCSDGLGLHWDEWWCPDCDTPCPENMWVEAGSAQAKNNTGEKPWEVR